MKKSPFSIIFLEHSCWKYLLNHVYIIRVPVMQKKMACCGIAQEDDFISVRIISGGGSDWRVRKGERVELQACLIGSL